MNVNIIRDDSLLREICPCTVYINFFYIPFSNYSISQSDCSMELRDYCLTEGIRLTDCGWTLVEEITDKSRDQTLTMMEVS